MRRCPMGAPEGQRERKEGVTLTLDASVSLKRHRAFPRRLQHSFSKILAAPHFFSSSQARRLAGSAMPPEK